MTTTTQTTTHSPTAERLPTAYRQTADPPALDRPTTANTGPLGSTRGGPPPSDHPDEATVPPPATTTLPGGRDGRDGPSGPVELRVAGRRKTRAPDDAPGSTGTRGRSSTDGESELGTDHADTSDPNAVQWASGRPESSSETRAEWSPATATQADVDRLVDRLYSEFERKLRVERERRGL